MMIVFDNVWYDEVSSTGQQLSSAVGMSYQASENNSSPLPRTWVEVRSNIIIVAIR